jgi:hypothetical protein
MPIRSISHEFLVYLPFLPLFAGIESNKLNLSCCPSDNTCVPAFSAGDGFDRIIDIGGVRLS